MIATAVIAVSSVNTQMQLTVILTQHLAYLELSVGVASHQAGQTSQQSELAIKQRVVLLHHMSARV